MVGNLREPYTLRQLFSNRYKSEQATSATAEATVGKGADVVCLKQYDQQCFLYTVEFSYVRDRIAKKKS